MIRTVTGDIFPHTAGHTQCHEHLFVEKGASFEISHSLLMEDMEKSVHELSVYAESGGGLIVDAQPGYFGRMAENLEKASVMTGVGIVASTGFHKYCFCDRPDIFISSSASELACFFVSEICDGMVASRGRGYEKLSCRAGIIKTAVESGGIVKNSFYEKLFTAAAEARNETGVPMLCHMEKGADALGVIDFLTERNVPPQKIIICHLDRTHPDAEYHKEVAGRGVYLDYDSINRLKYISALDELKLICDMVDSGYSGSLLLSLDTTNERLESYGGYMGLSYILNTFIPEMKKAGISGTDIRKMTCSNASEVLSI